MVVKKKRKHIKHIRIEQKGKVDMASYCVMFLEDGSPRDGVESICDIHFQHHPIKMDI